MTNLEALKAEVEPYSMSDDGYIKRLIDADLKENDTYESSNKITIAKCAIQILVSFLPLTNEKLGPTSQSYDRKGLEDKIHDLCEENRLNYEQYAGKPRVTMYRNLF